MKYLSCILDITYFLQQMRQIPWTTHVFIPTNYLIKTGVCICGHYDRDRREESDSAPAESAHLNLVTKNPPKNKYCDHIYPTARRRCLNDHESAYDIVQYIEVISGVTIKLSTFTKCYGRDDS